MGEKIMLDENDNSLYAEPADNDGFHICEENNNRIYIYYSEIEKLEQLLRKVKYEWNTNKQHSPSSGKGVPYEMGIYKPYDFVEYDRYIKSDEWKNKSRERRKLDGCCQSCGSKLNLQVHHKSYDSFGKEDIKHDLVTLCDDCHSVKTGIARKKRKGIVTDVSQWW